jgi:Holliday junction resolvase
MNTKAKGSHFERKTKALLEDDGWYVTKAGASLGVADLVALRRGAAPRLVQVKSGVGGPYAHFGPGERAELRRVAKESGAVAELCYWKPRARQPTWVPESAWPAPVALAA